MAPLPKVNRIAAITHDSWVCIPKIENRPQAVTQMPIIREAYSE